MADFSCALSSITTSSDCNVTGGIDAIFWTLDSSIDWTTMAGSGYFDEANWTITEWAMLSGGVWEELTFEAKLGSHENLWTYETSFYDIQINGITFSGSDIARVIAIQNALKCCGIVISIHWSNNYAWIVGKDFKSGAWLDPLTNCRINRHLNSAGTYGNADDKAREEVDFFCEQRNSPVRSTKTIAQMRLI